jgi:hypothetical protein
VFGASAEQRRKTRSLKKAKISWKDSHFENVRTREQSGDFGAGRNSVNGVQRGSKKEKNEIQKIKCGADFFTAINSSLVVNYAVS